MRAEEHSGTGSQGYIHARDKRLSNICAETCSTEGEYDNTESVDVTDIAEYTDSSEQFPGPSVSHTSPVDYGSSKLSKKRHAEKREDTELRC